MMEKPGGRRHDAFTDYHQRIQMGDEVHGFEAEAVSAWPSYTYTFMLSCICCLYMPWHHADACAH